MDDFLGVSLEKDVLPSLGPEYGLYLSWSGQALIPDAGVVLEVKDKPQLQRLINKLIQTDGVLSVSRH